MRTPGDDRSAALGGPMVGCGETLLNTLVRAARGAWANGQTMIGTEHVLADLIDRAQPDGMNVGPLADQIHERLKVSSGTATDGWHSADGGPVGVPGDARSDTRGTFLEARWNARRMLSKKIGDDSPEWSGAVAATVQRALDDAQHRGLAYANRFHLFAAMLADSTNRATELLRGLEVQPQRLLHGRTTRTVNKSDIPVSYGALKLVLTGIVNTTSSDRRRVGQVVRRWLFALNGDTMPVVSAVEIEAIRQAVRLDDRQVGAAHLLLAIDAIDEQLRGSHWEFSERFAGHSGAADLLRGHGADYATLLKITAGATDSMGPTDRGYAWRRNAWNPPTSANLASVVDLGLAESARRGHRHAGTDHLLMALLTDDESPCVQLLEAGGVDVASLRRDVVHRLS